MNRFLRVKQSLLISKDFEKNLTNTQLTGAISHPGEDAVTINVCVGDVCVCVCVTRYLPVCAEVPKPDLLTSSSPPSPPGSPYRLKYTNTHTQLQHIIS